MVVEMLECGHEHPVYAFPDGTGYPRAKRRRCLQCPPKAEKCPDCHGEGINRKATHAGGGILVYPLGEHWKCGRCDGKGYIPGNSS